MPNFLHPSLLWGLGLLAIPVLIHLINMVRHHRVRWAAMEFLLVSQKRNRTWILFKQFLLLLLRIAALALLVMVVAQPVLHSSWLGRSKAHHVVLLDDSYSMSDRGEGRSAFDAAKLVVQQIGSAAAHQVQPQQFTLLRFSRAGRLGRGAQPDLLQHTVDSEFSERLRERLSRLDTSELAAGPAEALAALDQILHENAVEERTVYLVSDFRARQWEDPGELRKQVQRLDERHIAVMLINCAETAHANLALTALAPLDEIRAAGVPLSMEIGVQNFGPAEAKNVNVALEEDGHGRPGVTIARIAPGRSGSERFTVNFPTAGQHQVTARLAADAVAADNTRYSVVDIPVDVPVLLVDGDAAAPDARRLADVFAPGGNVRTGVSPRIETPRYLAVHPLAAYRAVYLLDADRLDRSAVAALEAYVTGGGGLGVFLGERTTSRFVNDDLYRQGQGFFPLPLAGPTELTVDRLQPAPDVQISEHPIFRLITSQRNSDVATVNVDRYFAAPKGWRPPAESTVRVLARLRNGAPLIVEQRFGQGRVVAVLTSAAPTWNNWSQKGSFVATLLNMQAYLAGRPASDQPHPVGTPLPLEFDPAQYRPQVRIVPPHPTSGLSRDASAAEPGQPLTADATPTRTGMLAVTLADIDRSGYYEVHLTRSDGATDVRRFAVNVDPAEGDLKTMSRADLAARLEGVRFAYESADTFQYATRDTGGADLSRNLLYLLVLLLIAEQILAWSASYHPPARHPLPARGAAA